MLRIEDLLKDLADDGVMESTGSFTLDPKKAEEKLRHFSFAEAHHYLLKILQCAVAGGATWVKVITGAGKVCVEFDGDTMAEGEVAALAGYLLSQELAVEQRRFRHLAAGLRGAAACGPEAVIFDFFTGSRRVRRIWDKAGWRQAECPGDNKPALHRFILDRTFGQSMTAAKEEFVSAIGTGYTAEEKMLVDRCRYAVCGILLDGETVPGPRFGEARYPGYDIGSDPNPGEARPPRYIRSGFFLKDDYMVADHHLIERLVPSTADFPGCLPLPVSEATLRLDPPESGLCCAWIAITAALDPPRITYVEDGVIVESERDASDIPVAGFHAVVSTIGLQKDLTGFQLVRDESFERQRKWLLEQALEMKGRLLEELALFPNRERISEVLAS